MAKAKKKVTSGRRNPRSEKWHASNLFWGSATTCLTFVIAAVGFGMSGHAVLAHWLFAAAFPCGAMACWCAFRNVILRPSTRVLTLLGIATILCITDFLAIHSARSHIHIIAVDLISANAGDVIRSRVHLQNDGDVAIVRYLNCTVLAVADHSDDPKVQTNTENEVFEQISQLDHRSHGQNCQMGFGNSVPAHSIELNSDVIGKTQIPFSLLQSVSSGSLAIYSAGSIVYVDEIGDTRHSSYCYWTNGLVQGMKLCFVHNQEP